MQYYQLKLKTLLGIYWLKGVEDARLQVLIIIALVTCELFLLNTKLFLQSIISWRFILWDLTCWLRSFIALILKGFLADGHARKFVKMFRNSTVRSLWVDTNCRLSLRTWPQLGPAWTPASDCHLVSTKAEKFPTRQTCISQTKLKYTCRVLVIKNCSTYLRMLSVRGIQ